MSVLSQPHFHNEPEAFKFLESAALPFPRTRPSGTLGDREEVFTRLASGRACITRGCSRRCTAARPPRALTGERE